ncbi:MAG: type III pantothenate kinase [bacterium]|nr:MAG: type III pantothenate kinase [bacterium]
MKTVLAMDRGNRTLKAALFEDGKIGRRWTLQATDHLSEIAPILDACSPHGVVFSSVVPQWSRVAHQEFAGRRMGGVLEVGAGITLPFELLVAKPELLGPDRLCAACGAVSMEVYEAVIVDAGTAVTIDILSRDGFCGGSIFPGVDLLLDALHTGTAVLPPVAAEADPPQPPGRETRSAILSGVYWGLVGAVRELVTRSYSSLGADARVLITGGAAEFVARHLGLEATVVPDLVMSGLYYCFRLNVSDSPP